MKDLGLIFIRKASVFLYLISGWGYRHGLGMDGKESTILLSPWKVSGFSDWWTLTWRGSVAYVGVSLWSLLQQLSEDTRLMREHDPSVTELC